MEQITTNDLRPLFAHASKAATYACLEYQGVSLGLHSDEAALIDWFSRFFGGYFSPTARARTDAVVYSTRDPESFAQLKELSTSQGQRRSGTETEYVLDAESSIIYSREVDDEGKVEENCFALFRPDRKVLVASPGKLKDRQKTVKRSLRNLMKLLFIEKGWLPFHAAACVWNGTGICILGGKYAGKTTTLLNLLTRPRASLVSNDNVFLRDTGLCLEACGFPNKAGLRIGTLAAYPRLVRWIERTTDSFYPQIDAATFHDIVATTPPAELGSRTEKIVLLPTELAEQLDVPIQHVTPIQLVLVVQFDPSLDHSCLVPVTDREQVREYLSANFRALEKEKQDFLQRFFDFDDRTLQSAFAAILDRVGSSVAVRELRQSASTNEQSAELIAALTAGEASP